MSWEVMACRLDVIQGRGRLVLAEANGQVGGLETLIGYQKSSASERGLDSKIDARNLHADFQVEEPFAADIWLVFSGRCLNEAERPLLQAQNGKTDCARQLRKYNSGTHRVMKLVEFCIVGDGKQQ